MCFRLLAAVQGSPDETALSEHAFRCGLDVRIRTGAPASFLEVAWGDCACSLYTRKEGRDRFIRWVTGLVAQGAHVQLLFFDDDAPFDLDGAPVDVALTSVEREALAALPLGRVARLIRYPPVP